MEWYFVYSSTDLPISMDLIIKKNYDKTKTTFQFLMETVCLNVNVSSAKKNSLFDDAITAKVKLSVSVMQRDTRLFKYLAGLNSYHRHRPQEGVTYHILPKKTVWYLSAWHCYTEIFNLLLTSLRWTISDQLASYTDEGQLIMWRCH